MQRYLPLHPGRFLELSILAIVFVTLNTDTSTARMEIHHFIQPAPNTNIIYTGARPPHNIFDSSISPLGKQESLGKPSATEPLLINQNVRKFTTEQIHNI